MKATKLAITVCFLLLVGIMPLNTLTQANPTVTTPAIQIYPDTLPYDTQSNLIQTPNAPAMANGSEVIIVVALLALIRGVIALAFYGIKNSRKLL